MSSVPNLDLPSLLASLQSKYDAANTAGNAQYSNLLNSMKGTTGSVMGMFGQANRLMRGMGTTAKANIDANTSKQLGGSDQDLISRGLGNTTVRSSVRRGINSDSNFAKSAVDEAVGGQKAGMLNQQAQMMMGLGGMQGDAILSKSNVPPDASMYAQLIQTLAAHGGLGGVNSGAGSMTPPRSNNFVGPSQSQLSAPNSFVTRANAGGGGGGYGSPSGQSSVYTAQGGGFPQYQTLNPYGNGSYQTPGTGVYTATNPYASAFNNGGEGNYAVDMSGTQFVGGGGSGYMPQNGFGVQSFYG